MNKKIVFSLIFSLVIVFSGTGVFASVVAPPLNSALRNYWDITHASATNVNTIFDDYFNYLGGWANTVYYNGNLYDPCLASDKRIGFNLGFYDSSGTYVLGTSRSVKYVCVGQDFYFLSSLDNSQGYQTPAEILDEWVNAYSSSFSDFYVYTTFNYGKYGTPYSARYLLYFDSSGTRYLLNDDFSEYSTAVNGSCGSANNSSFSVFPSDNLCSSGVICSGQPYTDGTYYYWTCYGYGPGATSEDCRASVLVSTAQCGYLANTQYSDSSPPSGSNACLSGSVRDMLQLDNDSWLWYCEVSDDDFVPCSTFSDNPIVITPSLPSSPDIACEDILTGQGFANCVSSVFAWLFLPHQDTIDEFFQLSSLIKTKIPFGYVYSFRDEINNLTSSSPSDFSVALTFNGNDQVPVVNSDTFDVLGSDFKSTYFRFIRAILWISFGVWVFTLGRKLFLNNRDS
jgi:hypothetical protein